MEVSDNRRRVSLKLPPATLREPELDLERSYVDDRDRGAIDRIQSLLGDDPGFEPELYSLAEEKLANAARDGSGLLARSERNTRLMLDGLLRALGFTRVEVPSPRSTRASTGRPWPSRRSPTRSRTAAP